MIKNFLKEMFAKFKNSDDPEERDIANVISERKNQQLWIALAGKTGAGKSTLINLLFEPKPKLKVGVGKPGTTEAETHVLTLGGDRGTIKYTDLPGIGESKKHKAQVEATNIEYFKKCDLVLWLFKTDDSAKEIEEEFFEKISPKLKKKLIYGLSRCDKADGGNWYNKGREPSKGQKEFILNRIEDISETFGIPEDKILEFSAHKKYHIDLLTNYMISSIKKKGDILRHKMAEIILTK